MRTLTSSVRSLSVFAVALLTAASSHAEEVIRCRETWNAVFADREVAFHFAVQVSQAKKGRATWALTVDRHTVPGSAGETGIEAAPARPAAIAVHLRTPPVKPGVIVRGVLTVSIQSEIGQRVETTYEKTLWIFPTDPFSNRREQLKEWKISLFDPQERTSADFKKLTVPFEVIDSPGNIDDLKAGLLIVGEGASFKEHAHLPEQMVKAAARGLRVLCLAPAEGYLGIPGIGSTGPPPLNVSLRRQDVIRELDKRLDAEAWPPEGRVLARTFVFEAGEDRVLGRISEAPGGWTWVEAGFPSGGRLLVCGFALTGRTWEAGPVPRFLLVRLIEHLTR